MNHKSARHWQDILLIVGAIVAAVGTWGFDNMIAMFVGVGLMLLSIIVWWMYYRCPYCHVHLGRGNPKHCPNCGMWLGTEPEPEEKAKKRAPQHKKKKR